MTADTQLLSGLYRLWMCMRLVWGILGKYSAIASLARIRLIGSQVELILTTLAALISQSSLLAI